jgi:UDP-N-acetyl-D-galactosamine dehydrogenase
VSADEAVHEYGVRMAPWEELTGLDAMVLAVPHREFLRRSAMELFAPVRRGGVVVDLKSAVQTHDVRPDIQYWSL